MKQYDKYIRFEKILVKVQSSHPKDISRVHFKIIEQNGQIHKTKSYGTVNPTDIFWPCPLQFRYTAQPSFKFETICEHEYGYQIQDLKALYYGEIRIRPQDFFISNNFKVYNKSGQSCGKVSFTIKIVDRERNVKYNDEDEVQNRERIRVDLVAKMTFVQAKLQINPVFIKDYEGKKAIHQKAKLILKIDGVGFVGSQKNRLHWFFKGVNKFQLFDSSDDKIIVQIKQDQNIILQGFLMIEALLKNKRFLTHNLQVQNQSGSKIGTLKLQMRILEKKEILDLMYSPQKLQNVKMEKTDFDTQLSRFKLSQDPIKLSQDPIKLSQDRIKLSIDTLQKKINSSQPVLHKLPKRMSLDLKSSSFMKLSKLQSPEGTPKSSSKNKYDTYFKNQYQQIRFAQSKRFQEHKAINPYISYTGHYDMSDFSPKRKLRAANFSKTQRTDFTKPYKDNPGIGNYHLPSIWERS